MKKTDGAAALVESLMVVPVSSGGGEPGAEPGYLGFFECFNQQRYFEAHDVLESLWLDRRRTRGETDPCCSYFKGLIQVAGAFVHLQKQRARPGHPKDGRRLHPASRLFQLAMENLSPFRPVYLALDVEGVCALCDAQYAAIVASGYTLNPWRPDAAPVLKLQ